MKHSKMICFIGIMIFVIILSTCGGGGGGGGGSYYINGLIFLCEDPITLGGVTVTLSGANSATETTYGSGSYSFGGLGNGSYTVTPSMAGYTFSPVSTQVTISGASNASTDFFATPTNESCSAALQSQMNHAAVVKNGRAANVINATGTWVASKDIDDSCLGESHTNNTIIITQSGGNVISIVDQTIPAQYTGTINGNTISVSGSYTVNGHTQTENLTMTVDTSNSTFIGSGSYTWTDVDTTCHGTTSITGSLTQATLTVNIIGNGLVTDSTVVINCNNTCSELFSTIGTSIILTAIPAVGYNFAAWSGCDSTTANQCTVTMHTSRDVTASFIKQ